MSISPTPCTTGDAARVIMPPTPMVDSAPLIGRETPEMNFSVSVFGSGRPSFVRFSENGAMGGGWPMRPAPALMPAPTMS